MKCMEAGGIGRKVVMEAQVEDQSPDTPAVQVELIDADHDRWPQVLEMIDRQGVRGSLGIEPDWVPARRSLLVAFVQDRAAGHLSFRLEPVIDRQAADRRMRIEARVDGCAVEDGFDPNVIVRQLEAAARQRATSLQAQIVRPGNCP